MPGLTTETQQQLLGRVGDALRRDDRPAAAAKALKEAIQLSPDGAQRAKLHTQLAGVLHQAGMLDVAADIGEEGLAGIRGDAMAESVALDTLIGILLALGRLPEADRYIARLEVVAPTIFRPAYWFREGARLRMCKDFARADLYYSDAASAMRRYPQASGAVAAAEMGRAEVALFVGDSSRARSHYERAGQLWTTAGRRDGVYRSEAGLIRAALSEGQATLASGLSEPIRFARERQMPLLLAHLLLARGAAAGSDADLSEAVAIGQETRAVFLEGRARLVRLRCGGGYGDEAEARQLLAGDAAWRAVLDGAPMPW